MAQGTVVLAGSLPVEHLALDLLVAEFGWSLREVDSVCHLAALNLEHNLVTVLFNPQNLALPSDEALRAILDAAPGALPILCHRFADEIDWPQVAQVGAFHSLLLPFNAREVRHSLGFVWGARRRSAVIALPHRPDRKAVIGGQRPRSHARAAGIVA